MTKTDIKSMTLEELEDFTVNVLGEKKFRAKQMYEWMHVKMVDSADEMTNLSAKLRAQLKEKTEIAHLTIVKRLISKMMVQENICSSYRMAMLSKASGCSISMAIPSVFLHRLVAVWGAVSVRQPLVDWQKTSLQRRCLKKYMRYRRIQVNVCQTLLLWAVVNRWIIMLLLCVSYV